MSDPIQFYANVDSVAGGDDEVRIVLSVKDTPVDLAAAVGMLGKLNRVLRVSAYVGPDSLASFAACVPQMKTGIQFRRDKAPVIRLDIPARDALSALRLVGYSDRLIRFEVEDEGERVKKGKREKPAPGPHGQLWKELFLAGFIGCPGIREAVARLPKSGYEKPRDLLRQLFGVESLSREVGPEKIYADFPAGEFPQVKSLVETAINKSGGRQG